MNPPVFVGSKVGEDPQEFVEEVYKIVDAMGVTSVEKAGLATYQLKDRAASTRIRDFLNLDPPSFTGSDPNEDSQDSIDQIQQTLDVMHMSGKEVVELATYRLKGVAILRYAPNVVTIMEDRVHRYVDRLDSYLVRDWTIDSLNKDMDIARMQAFTQKLEDQRQRRRAQETERGQSKRARSTGQFTPPQGHLMRDCPKKRMGDIAQPTGSVVASSSSVPPLGRGQQVPTGHGRGVRGASSSSEIQNRTYVLRESTELGGFT
uniref:Retrotransposon gag protein n=1 Tax=Solanum tuberosum TaxID=4113 RepID=M1DBW5_SOLTU